MSHAETCPICLGHGKLPEPFSHAQAKAREFVVACHTLEKHDVERTVSYRHRWARLNMEMRRASQILNDAVVAFDAAGGGY